MAKTLVAAGENLFPAVGPCSHLRVSSPVQVLTRGEVTEITWSHWALVGSCSCMNVSRSPRP